MSLKEIFVLTAYFAVSVALSQSKFDSLLSISKNSVDTINVIDSLNDLAYSLRNSNADSLLLLSEKSGDLAELIGYSKGIASANMNIAIVFTAQGNYYNALRLMLEVRKIFESIGERERIASSINNIGRIYNFMGDYDLALKYYEESASIFTELNSLEREAAIINNIGYIHKLQSNYNLSLKFLNRSLSKAKKVNDKSAILYPTYNKGSVFMLMDQIDSAKHYLNQSLSLSRELRDQYILSLSLIDYGHLYIKLNQLKLAEQHFKDAYQISTNSGLKNERRDAARFLYNVYESQDKYKNALIYHKIFKEINDDLFDKDIAKKIAFQEAEFAFNQNKIQEEAKRKNLELARERDLNREKWIRNSLIAGIICLILICYLLYENFRKKRAANQALRELNSTIESQSEELKRANLEITVINSNLEIIVNKRTKELKRKNQQLKDYLSTNSHIVRAPLARILGLVDLHEPKVSDNLDFINESLKASAEELDEALREINKKLSDEPPN